MLADIKALLADPAFRDCDPPPVVDYVTFFDGNSDEESLAPNQWGYGRPTMGELYARFAQIAQRPDVERVLVGLHGDWNDPVFDFGQLPQLAFSAEQLVRVFACIDMGSKPARLATPTGPGEGRVLRMPVDLRRGRPFALRLLEFRQFG